MEIEEYLLDLLLKQPKRPSIPVEPVCVEGKDPTNQIAVP
jgi:hypothetical protein